MNSLGNLCNESWRRKRKDCGGNDLQKRKVLNLAWKSEWVIEYQIIPGGPKKRPELSHGVMQHSRWNESAEKHVCRPNEQKSSNMSMNFYLKRFHISRDTSEIVLHVIKWCLQAFYHHRNRFSKKLVVSAGVSWNGKTEIFFHRPSKD